LTSRRACCAVALAASLLAGACGSDPANDRKEIRGTIEALQKAFARGDLAAACDAMTPDAHVHVGEAAHDAPKTCEKDIRMIYRGIRKAGLPDSAPRVTAVAVDGDRATARVVLGGGTSLAVPVAREDGEWKVDALYGDIPGGHQPDYFPAPGQEEES
jgi:ketosteroid isomerase-like protein